MEARTRRLDLAARAAWLYYVKRRTQDEIAVDLNVSRPNAQRLVALAISEGLIKFRLDHPLLKSLELGQRLRDRFALDVCEVAPSVDGHGDPSAVALFAAQYIETLLAPKASKILAFGTGRTLLETVRQVSAMDRSDHKIVSLVGNLTRNGRASPYDVVMRLADRIGGACYPLPLPVLTDTEEECQFLKAQRGYGTVLNLFREADAVMLGVGTIGTTAPLLIDGFVTPEELAELEAAGAIGELRSRPIGPDGRLIETPLTARLTAVPLMPDPPCPTILVASGRAKIRAIDAALKGRLANGIIVDEPTAARLLEVR